MLPAPPPLPASQSRTINVDSAYGLNAIATTRYLQFYSAISRADHITVLLLPALKANRTPSDPHLSPLVSLRTIGHRQITIWFMSYTMVCTAPGRRRSNSSPQSTCRRTCHKALRSFSIKWMPLTRLVGFNRYLTTQKILSEMRI
jgi:hypothetical protein